MTRASASIAAAFAGRLGTFAVDIRFETPLRGITVLFGPSGSGKTTTLRCVAGLHRLRGRMDVGEETWQDDARGVFRKPHERPVGYVFQEASLFPHLSVRGNLLYGARRAARIGAARGLDFDDVVGLLGIAHLLHRTPAALSGGERQRVSVGRALLSQPRLLLMDEPLSALDRSAKDDLLPYFEVLHENLSIPMLYVTHDVTEAERLADTMLLFERGRVLATGPLSTLEADPGLPLLHAPQAAVTLAGRVIGIDDSYALTTLSVDGGTLIVPGRRGAVGSSRRLRIGAADVSFTLSRPVDTTVLNCLPARVVSVEGQGEGDAQTNVVAALGEDGTGARIVGRVTRRSQEALGLVPGVAVFAQIKSVALVAARWGAVSPPRSAESP